MSDYSRQFAFDEPIVYRSPRGAKETVTVHPVRMRQYSFFMNLAPVLLFDKNSVPDVEVISMSYLGYLSKLTREDENVGLILLHLLRMVLMPDEKDPEKLILLMSNDGFQLGGKIFDKQDFDEIRSIIIKQNLLVPPDETVQKEIRDAIAEGERIRRKLSGNKTAGIEDQMVAVSVQTGLTLEYIYDMTVRKFIKMIERIDQSMHYKIYLAASMSGFVTFKDKSVIKHWLADIRKGKHDGMMELSEFENKLSGAVE